MYKAQPDNVPGPSPSIDELIAYALQFDTLAEGLNWLAVWDHERNKRTCAKGGPDESFFLIMFKMLIRQWPADKPTT